nr:PEP-CTERM sorting domain-containing protein [Chthoniobacterales bacterium]
NGNSTSDADNSAVFAGILDTTPDIFSVSFSATDQFGSVGFAINQLDIVKGTQGVPESGATLPLLGLGIVALGFMRKFARA